MSSISEYLGMIRFSHTVFALPFAYSGALFAGLKYGLPFSKLIWITFAMVGARSVAMGMNRIIDWRIDRLNPRTANRAIPAGRIPRINATLFVTLFLILFLFSAYMLNMLAFYLSPAALIIVVGYSYTKRFTWMTHYILGLALSIAPMGAWIGISGKIELFPLIISSGVLFWTAGFDILYSFQDYEYDLKNGLYSIPVRFGINRSYIISRLTHLIAYIFFLSIAIFWVKSIFYVFSMVIILVMLVYQHVIVDHRDDKSINRAFFIGNAVISIIYFVGVLGYYLSMKGN